MKHRNNNMHFILMADIIKSREAQAGMLMKDFEHLIQEIYDKNKNSFLSPMTITLGDEFQSIVKSLLQGIETILDINEKLIQHQYNFSLRYVLYQGMIETPINKKSAHGMLGEGLTKARETLNRLKSHKEKQRIAIVLQNENLSITPNKLFFLYFSLTSNWKYDDYKLISTFIQEKDYKTVAQKVHMDTSSTWRRERTLKMKEYFTIKELIYHITHGKSY